MTHRVIEPVCRGLRVIFTRRAIKVQLRTWLWWSTVHVMRPDTPALWEFRRFPQNSGAQMRQLVARLAIEAYLRS